MPNETNLANAEKLLALAKVYRDATVTLTDPYLTIMTWTKVDCAKWIRAIGGRFVKKEGPVNDIRFVSSRIPCIEVAIPRNIICRRLNPEYECEPLLSPEEEAEILTEAGA
jgi:hypothetical protein